MGKNKRTLENIGMQPLWNEWPDPATTKDPITTTGPDDLKKILASEYNDQGSWARHYSTVRMTLGTFFLTGSIGIIYKKWDDPFDCSTAVLAGVILAVGIAVFLRFTFLTFNSLNHQLRIVNSYRTKFPASADKKVEQVGYLAKFGGTDGVALAFLAIAFYALVLYLWYIRPKPGPPTPPVQTVSLPVPSRFAVTYSAVHLTNHGREAHTFLIDESTGDLWQMVCAPNGAVSFNRIQRKE